DNRALKITVPLSLKTNAPDRAAAGLQKERGVDPDDSGPVRCAALQGCGCGHAIAVSERRSVHSVIGNGGKKRAARADIKSARVRGRRGTSHNDLPGQSWSYTGDRCAVQRVRE